MIPVGVGTSKAGFTVGVRRNPAKILPGRVNMSILSAVIAPSADEKGNLDVQDQQKYQFCYAISRYTAHDPLRTEVVEKKYNDQKTELAVFEVASDDFRHRIDIPHFDYDGFITVELYETDRLKKDELDWEDNRDILLGKGHIPIVWILNCFGAGFMMPMTKTTIFKLRMRNPDGVNLNHVVEIQMSFQFQDHDQLSTLRWTTFQFDGDYKLDRSRSSSMEKLLLLTKVPFVLRKIEEVEAEEELEVRTSNGGSMISFTTKNEFYHQSTGPMQVDVPFQSVKTQMGTVVEKKLMWDFSVVTKLDKFQPYPNPILLAVTRYSHDMEPIPETWDLKQEANDTLLELNLGVGTERIKRTYIKQPKQPKPPPKFPAVKVSVPAGTLKVAIIRGLNLVSPSGGNNYINAYGLAKLEEYLNEDKSYETPQHKEVKEELTRSLEDANPYWNQRFSFDVPQLENSHSVLSVEIFNQDPNSPNDVDDSIGFCMIPLPWVYNGFGSKLGPNVITSFQGMFKLKKGDQDPNIKAEVGFGHVVLQIEFTPKEGLLN